MTRDKEPSATPQPTKPRSARILDAGQGGVVLGSANYSDDDDSAPEWFRVPKALHQFGVI